MRNLRTLIWASSKNICASEKFAMSSSWTSDMWFLLVFRKILICVPQVIHEVRLEKILLKSLNVANGWGANWNSTLLQGQTWIQPSQGGGCGKKEFNFDLSTNLIVEWGRGWTWIQHCSKSKHASIELYSKRPPGCIDTVL